MAKSVKLDDKTYEELNSYAGEMRVRLNRPVSLSEAVEDLLRKKSGDIMKFAGLWKMSDKEWKKISGELDKGWARWKIR